MVKLGHEKIPRQGSIVAQAQLAALLYGSGSVENAHIRRHNTGLKDGRTANVGFAREGHRVDDAIQ